MAIYHHHHLRPAAAAAATICLALGAHAQTSTVTVTGRSDRGPAVGGFADTPATRTPLQTSSWNSATLADQGIDAISGLTLLDPSTTDAYDAPGYWSIIAVRGFTLDNRFNYQRDGLPINAETAIGFENKERLELLKGTSGIQAGTSAPGGLVNLVVKRPVAGQRSATLAWEQDGTWGASADIGDRAGPDGAFGWRVNLAGQHLDPRERNTQGSRWLAALATDWRLPGGGVLEAEVESSRQKQPSVAGFSMLGDRVPAASEIDPRINLNHQPWNLPVVLAGTTASLRWQQPLTADWKLTLHAMQQRLHSDDRTAFPYGLYDPATFDCSPCDRFASDGSFTYWQYVSDNERRTSTALQAAVAGRVRTGSVSHAVEAGVLRSRYTGRFQDQVFDIAGLGRIDDSLVTPASSGFTDANTDRTENNTEFFARDALRWDNGTSLWAGVRAVQLHRQSERTSPDSDGSLRATDTHQNEATPWLALSHQITPATLLYVSWGQGLESTVAPNRPRYTNAGQALSLHSRQVEAGAKYAADALEASVIAFNINRDRATDIGSCDTDDSCTTVIDGSERHRGIEAQLALRQDEWNWQLAGLWLDAERRGSQDANMNGTRPENVPRTSLRAGTAYRPAALPGLELQAHLVAEGNRVVLPYDETVTIPGWSRVDIGARWTQALSGASITWRTGIDNLFDRRAWKESPYQFGHVYLYPLEPRTVRASAQISF